jgi:hypothetical protein
MQDYRAIHEAYWANFTHQMVTVEMTESQTDALVARCRRESVTVNSAIATAFSAAQSYILSEGTYHPRVVIAGNLRDRLREPAGEAVGFYAGGISLSFHFDEGSFFWDNARRLHQVVQPLYTDKKLFSEPLTWCHLHPAIMEALTYKMVGPFVPPESPRHRKLADFSKRDDVVSSIMKREKMDTFDNILIGTAVTNLTRMDFPHQYGNLELDRLILNPGGAYPLSMVNLVVGAVTYAGKLSLVLEFAQERLDMETADAIKNQAVKFLQET